MIWTGEAIFFAQLGFPFYRPGSFRNSGLRRWSALGIRLASFRGLRRRSVVDPSAASAPAARICSSVGLAEQIFFRVTLVCVAPVLRILKEAAQEAAVFAWELRFCFASNDYFLCMYFPDENDTAEYYQEKSFQHEAA